MSEFEDQFEIPKSVAVSGATVADSFFCGAPAGPWSADLLLDRQESEDLAFKVLVSNASDSVF